MGVGVGGGGGGGGGGGVVGGGLCGHPPQVNSVGSGVVLSNGTVMIIIQNLSQMKST